MNAILTILSWFFLIAAVVMTVQAIGELLTGPLNVPLSVMLPVLLAGVAVGLAPHVPWRWGMVLFIVGGLGVIVPQAVDCLVALRRLHELEKDLKQYYE